jgi:hypothetical protein
MINKREPCIYRSPMVNWPQKNLSHLHVENRHFRLCGPKHYINRKAIKPLIWVALTWKIYVLNVKSLETLELFVQYLCTMSMKSKLNIPPHLKTTIRVTPGLGVGVFTVAFVLKCNTYYGVNG